MIIEGVDQYRVCEPLFEGIRVILSFRGEPYSADYIQGISGAAFRIGGICPCAPTCTYAMEPTTLISMLGYEIEHLAIGQDQKDGEYALERIKKEIDRGRPVLVWHAFTNYEWDVVCGYDDEKKLLYGRGSYMGFDQYTSADETRFIHCDICPGVIFIGQKVNSFDARKAEEEALKEAVRHAYSTKNADIADSGEWVFMEGISSYQRWFEDFKSPDKKRTAGDSYCCGIYGSTHRAAAGFLREIAPKYAKAESHLLKATEHFQNEADILEKGNTLLGWSSPEGPHPERNAKVHEMIKEACDQYTLGIQNIEKAIKYL